MSTCKSCGASVLWAVTQNDKAIPIDPTPVANGNIELERLPLRRANGRRAETTYRAIVHGKAEAGGVDLFGGERYVSHFSTCPNAESHRK